MCYPVEAAKSHLHVPLRNDRFPSFPICAAHTVIVCSYFTVTKHLQSIRLKQFHTMSIWQISCSTPLFSGLSPVTLTNIVIQSMIPILLFLSTLIYRWSLIIYYFSIIQL